MTLITVGGITVAIDDVTVQWRAGMEIDADGSPHAYAPPGLQGLDWLASAGSPGHWYGLVTGADGSPIIQGLNDPAPGFYVSPTALGDHTKAEADPKRYVDAETFPYLSVPPELRHWMGGELVHMGDVAMVTYRDQQSVAVVADVGPHGKLGEGSIALARALLMDPSPKHGGTGSGVSVVVYRGSTRGWPRTLESVQEQVAALRSA
jgi:hypothetical protein